LRHVDDDPAKLTAPAAIYGPPSLAATLRAVATRR